MVLEFGCDRQSGEHDAGMHRPNYEFGVAALNEVTELAGAGGCAVGFGVFGGELNLTAGDPAALVDEVDGDLRRLVLSVTPGCEHTGQIAMVPDHDRSRRLRVYVFHQSQIGGTGDRAPRQGAFEEATARHLFAMVVISPFEVTLLHKSQVTMHNFRL